ncbi:MAG: DNA repair protein RadA, partial [Actinomycetota bacterium]|nr:DNA repair protein RadA [Actinomycetota bacterium]
EEDLVAVGEVGLAGEVRRVPGIERRLAEAVRLGFRTALIPRGCSDVPAQLEPVVLADVAAAVAHIAARAQPMRSRAVSPLPQLEPVSA